MKRRQFLAQTSLATAGIITSAHAYGSTMAISPKKAKLDQIGFQVYTVRNQVKDNLNTTLEKLAKYGYDYAETYGLYGDSVMGHPIATVRKAFDDAGIDIRSTHCMTGAEAPGKKGSMSNEWQMGVDAASALGAENIVCAYLLDGERKTIDDYKKVAELLNKSGELALKSGIQLGYHNHAFEFETLEGKVPMDILMTETDPNLVKLELDIYWSTKAAQDPIKLFEKHSGRINLWHVKDMDNSDEGGMTEVGNGKINWKNVFANAQTSGMNSFFVEQDRGWAKSDIESLGTSHKYLKKLRY